MRGRVVAVLGISGVGKTTMVTAFTQGRPWVHSIQASTLLKEATAATNTEALRTASATDIHANQDRLTSAFSELRRRHPDRHIIFDGHSLIDNDEGVVVIPTSTFVRLAPDMIMFLEDAADAILVRRAADVGRVRPRRSADEITSHQNTAKDAAFRYASTLRIPYATIRSGDFISFEERLLIAFQQN
jgi:adenylate kinase